MLLTTWIIILLLGLSSLFQVFPIISAPITTSIKLATYHGFSYGVFGWCHKSTRLVDRPPSGWHANAISNGVFFCTIPKIGYESQDAHLLKTYFVLPSYANFKISSLLVFHVISYALSTILFICSFALLTRLRSKSAFVLILALASILAYLVSLLSFLLDLVLFTSAILWPSWLVSAAALFLAVTTYLLWHMRRIVSMKTYERLHKQESQQIPLYNIQQSESLLSDLPDIRQPEKVSQ